jgi:hypothetical protein
MGFGESLAAVSPFVMVIAIVGIVYGSRIAKSYFEAKGKHGPADDHAAAEMQAQINKLADRVAVLEKLATDEDRKLAGEIERLRDRPGAPRY